MKRRITILTAALALLTLLIPFSGWGQAPQAPKASITIDPNCLTLDAEMHQGDDNLPLTYENIIVENARSFGFQFYTAEGEETETQISQMGTGPAYYATTSPWCFAMVTPQTGNDAFQVTVGALANDEGEARAVYFKVYAYDADSSLVYSNLAAVTQVAPGDNFFYFYKDIAGYGDDNTVKTGWNLIASPVASVTPTADNGFLTNTYDLYRFNQNPTATNDEYLEWENYKTHNFNLISGKGYLYANSGTVILKFSGDPYEGDGVVPLTYSTANEDANMHGWNLIGNPFNSNVTVDAEEFMIMNETGSQIIPADANHRTIAPMQGIFVHANEEGESVTFIRPDGNAHPNSNPAVVMNLVQNRGNVIDRAIVRFGEGKAMPKFQLFENNIKLYIPQDNKDYAVVRTESQGTMPVNFRANENGTYTLTVNPENVEMNYLHLIDNMTGADIDLLQTPSYSFNATTTDYESRFKLVFATNNEDGASTGSATDETFAFYSNGNWIINNPSTGSGPATLQVVDLMGRILSSETVNGSVSKTINATPGVYMLRLINGENVKVQKVVIE